MSSTQFIAILPKPTNEGDKVLISGKLTSCAKEFSINFANEIDEEPQSVSYRFKCDLVHNVLIEGYKENDEWMDCKETQFDALDGLEFALEFGFRDNSIYVYGDGHNRITEFQPERSFESIQSIQVCGDVDKITNLSFSYT